MFLLVVLASLCLFWCIQFYWKRRRLYRFSSKIPGPTGLPFIGCAYIFLWGDAADIAKRFMRLFDDYPEISRVWMSDQLYYLISKPEYLEIVLNSPSALGKMELYDFLKHILGNGLISGPVKMWRKHRKIIAPSLNQKILYDHVDKMSEQCHILTEILQKHCGKGDIDHCRYITDCALDIICETILGISMNAQASDAHYSKIFDKFLEIAFIRIFKVIYHVDFIFRRTKVFQEQEKITAFFKDITHKIIDKKIEQLKYQVHMEDDKKKPFLDLVVEKYLSNEFTQEEMEDEVNTFLLAGTDTNATSTSFILLLLGMHQDIQQKLYEEVIDVLGPDRLVTVDDLPKLKYTERVVKESLRVFPGAPFVARVVEEDIDLGDVIIPKGANISAGYLTLHRNEKYWPEPFKFDPDRFLPERSLNRHPYTWLPFSGGPRNCIGMKYGMMVMKIMTAMVIRKFRVTSSIKSIQDIELTTNIVLKPRNGFKLAFESR